MNNYFFKTCCLLLITFNSFAQINVQYGPKIGLTESGLHIINNTDKLNHHPGLNLLGGLFLRAGVKKFELQTELYYQAVGGTIQKGTNYRFPNRYQYVSVPVLLGYKVVDGLTLQAGPEYSWAVNKGFIYGPDRATDMGIAGGVRIDLLDAFALLSLNIRYTYGLQNVTNRLDSRGVLQDYRMRSLQIALTYNFSDYYKFSKKHKKIK